MCPIIAFICFDGVNENVDDIVVLSLVMCSYNVSCDRWGSGENGQCSVEQDDGKQNVRKWFFGLVLVLWALNDVLSP